MVVLYHFMWDKIIMGIDGNRPSCRTVGEIVHWLVGWALFGAILVDHEIVENML